MYVFMVITAIQFFATIMNLLSQLHYLILHGSDPTLPPAVLGMLYSLLLHQPKLLAAFPFAFNTDALQYASSWRSNCSATFLSALSAASTNL